MKHGYIITPVRHGGGLLGSYQREGRQGAGVALLSPRPSRGGLRRRLSDGGETP